MTAFLMKKILIWEAALNFFSKIVSSYFFNNFLRFGTEGYLEITFGVLLNLYFYKLDSTPEIVSTVISIPVLILCILFPFMWFVFIFDKKKQIMEGNSNYLKRFGTMYADFRVDNHWVWFQYYPIFLIRRFVFILFLIVLTDYPEVQCNFFILFSMLVSPIDPI